MRPWETLHERSAISVLTEEYGKSRSSQTQCKVSRALQKNPSMSCHLKITGREKKMSRWLLHELNEEHQCRHMHLFICLTRAQKTSPFLPSGARTFERCNRDAHMSRPITAQQRTSCHAVRLDISLMSKCIPMQRIYRRVVLCGAAG
ncbi:hypothetical protein Y032_0387g465 [Ancylostoma ceylanicum]|uniref:Uncharacterized protein n=1 Tax=Ancylostoma ceylanicum TaxID=53326 RepID=A0A016RSD1_9BILA|nr:hypothetical protein Y032_0387g465 [Ancylostoma ceylanicum]